MAIASCRPRNNGPHREGRARATLQKITPARFQASAERKGSWTNDAIIDFSIQKPSRGMPLRLKAHAPWRVQQKTVLAGIPKEAFQNINGHAFFV
jgi:hypothetical protein